MTESGGHFHTGNHSDASSPINGESLDPSLDQPKGIRALHPTTDSSSPGELMTDRLHVPHDQQTISEDGQPRTEPATISSRWKSILGWKSSPDVDTSIRLDTEAGRFSDNLRARSGTRVNLDGIVTTMSEQKLFVKEDRWASQSSPATGIAPEVADKIRDAVSITEDLAAEGVRINCFAFSTLLSGGEVHPAHYANYDGARWKNINNTFTYDNDSVESQSVVDEHVLPTMQPLAIGIRKDDGSFVPSHTIVRLPRDGDQEPCYISKLGGGDVVVTDLAGIMEFYRATHVTPVTAIATDGKRNRPVLRYSAPKDEPGSQS
jgi:hypothetical protein